MTQKTLSAFRSNGRGLFRFRTATCCCRARISVWSAARSAKISMILCMPERVSGGDAKFQGFCDRWNKWEGQPDEGSSEPAAVRLGSTQEKSRRVIADSNGDRSGDTRPLWITGLSPPNSWRRQPGYLQLDQVRHPKHRVWGYDRTLKVRNFRSTKVGNFQSQLTASVSASSLPAKAEELSPKRRTRNPTVG